MKTFEKGGKINFVDDNNVFVGFDNRDHCCENFGYCITKKVPTKEVFAASEEINTEGFNFDKTFCDAGQDDDFDSGAAISFKLTKGDEVIYLTLYNYQNGYYTHGFTFQNADKTIITDGGL